MENAFDLSLTDDQYFLLYLIIGVYFGPDLKEGSPQKSSLQRRVEGLPKYHANDLVGSQMKTTVIEQVYYQVLSKADQSVVVKQPLLLQYINGNLQNPPSWLQFNDLFSPELHKRSQIEKHLIIDNVVLITSPEINYLIPADIERFKRLTGLQEIILDRELMHIIADQVVYYNRRVQHTSLVDDTNQLLNVQHVECIPSTQTYTECIEPSESSTPFGPSLCNKSLVSDGSMVPLSSEMTASSEEEIDQGMLFLPCCPSKEEWSNLVAAVNNGFALTGSAARGQLGPVLGLLDIGESEDSYLFRVSLPGVRRDERSFNCEVESDGTVIIKGVTVTGERTVEKHFQVFEMLSQNLCPPGPFSISFKLPGPVDPQQFLGTFATDGILEGIAFKARRYRDIVPSYHHPL